MVRVVIHQDEDGEMAIYADGGAEVFWVDERAPDDRTYKMSPHPVPQWVLDKDYGSKDDGSPADARLRKAMSDIEGRPFLEVVQT